LKGTDRELHADRREFDEVSFTIRASASKDGRWFATITYAFAQDAEVVISRLSTPYETVLECLQAAVQKFARSVAELDYDEEDLVSEGAGHDSAPDACRLLAPARLAGAKDELTRLQTEYEVRRSAWSDIVDHMATLYETVCRYPGARVLELGVRSGNSTSAFLAAVEAVDGHLWSVDLIPPEVPAWWTDTARWTLTIGNDLSQDIANAEPAVVDVLFLDTSHTYEHTLAELRTYVPRVRAGGVVLCHDTELEAPEDAGANPPFPVAKALDTFCAETGRPWVNLPGSYGLGVIEISATENPAPPATA
jgi:predicted O-methyltransferase YrrM